MTRVIAALRSMPGIWRRNWYHLAGLAVLLPALYLQTFLDEQAMFLGDAEDDLREVRVLAGPWSLRLQERGEQEPYWSPEEGFLKGFRIVPCENCADEIRAIYISLRRPGSSAFGALFEGNPYRAFADMRITRGATAADKVWITVEGWDGSRHQIRLPLEETSPITARWLSNQ